VSLAAGATCRGSCVRIPPQYGGCCDQSKAAALSTPPLRSSADAGGKFSHILNLGTRWRWIVGFSLRSQVWTRCTGSRPCPVVADVTELLQLSRDSREALFTATKHHSSLCILQKSISDGSTACSWPSSQKLPFFWAPPSPLCVPRALSLRPKRDTVEHFLQITYMPHLDMSLGKTAHW